MIKFLLTALFSVICFTVVSKPFNPEIYNELPDSNYSHGSGVKSITLNQVTIKNLANLGMLWGFIKYYHSAVSKGDYNMDAALFNILPAILAAKNENNASEILEHWVDGFGIPPLCNGCPKFANSPDTKLSPDYGYLFSENNFPKTLTGKLEYIKQNRYNNTDKHYYVQKDQEIGVKFQHENPYYNQPFPDAGLRLLSLFRYWNMVQYFFPNRALTGEDWNNVLVRFIPVFVDAGDTLQYQLACLKLIAGIHDSHADISDGGDEIEKMKGNKITPFHARFIEDKLVVTGYYKDVGDIKDKVKPGDIIDKIDGTTVAELIERYLPLTSASNYETQLRNMSGSKGFLLRSNNTQAQLTIIRDGKSINVEVPRIDLEDYMQYQDYYNTSNSYKILPGNIGYIYPGNLNENDLDHIKILLGNTKGIIIDMRCYPSVFMPYTYGAWFKPDSSEFVAFSGASVDIPGYFKIVETHKNGGGDINTYKGKLVIIVNEITQSRAEFTTMALSTVPGAVVIGSKTSGADGGIFDIVLPGGIKTAFSGIGVYYPDGTITQRVGVKIDKIVKPTINAIKEGRDELLEEAIKIINR